MKSKAVNINGKKRKLSLSIDDESVNIYVDNGETEEPTHICYWHIAEVEKDAEVSLVMVNAVNLFHTNPQELIDRLKLFHISIK